MSIRNNVFTAFVAIVISAAIAGAFAYMAKQDAKGQAKLYTDNRIDELYKAKKTTDDTLAEHSNILNAHTLSLKDLSLKTSNMKAFESNLVGSEAGKIAVLPSVGGYLLVVHVERADDPKENFTGTYALNLTARGGGGNTINSGYDAPISNLPGDKGHKHQTSIQIAQLDISIQNDAVESKTATVQAKVLGFVSLGRGPGQPFTNDHKFKVTAIVISTKAIHE